jgi:hypothetical protein
MRKEPGECTTYRLPFTPFPALRILHSALISNTSQRVLGMVRRHLAVGSFHPSFQSTSATVAASTAADCAGGFDNFCWPGGVKWDGQ